MNSINQKLDILENETSQWNGFNWWTFNITRRVFMTFCVFNVAEDRVEKSKHFLIFQAINSYYLGIISNMSKILQITKLQRHCLSLIKKSLSRNISCDGIFCHNQWVNQWNCPLVNFAVWWILRNLDPCLCFTMCRFNTRALWIRATCLRPLYDVI